MGRLQGRGYDQSIKLSSTAPQGAKLIEYPYRNVTRDEAFAEVAVLVETFEKYFDRHVDPSYGESALRDDFIRPLMWALGWDVEHKLQRDPLQQEVKVERSVDVVGVGAGRKRADYALFVAPKFRSGDERLFIEVKKPSANLHSEGNYFQAVRYGWSVQNPIAVLTNFTEIVVLDARYKPDLDTIAECRIPGYSFKYQALRDPEEFSKLYYLIGREGISSGSLERLAEALPKRRGKAVQRGLFPGGYQKVDDTFLQELNAHREALAKSFKRKNEWLDSETLTEITQRVLDRLIFLRFLEDKLIETKERVGAFGDKGSVWADFVASSRRLDGIYNGIVFKYHDLIDGQKLNVDERDFGDLCEDLASENTPYDFNTIPIHILGSIYEEFLGHVIVATSKRATLVKKPEARSSGGVFYTPEYVVRYIVEKTIGPLIEGKSPSQIAGLRFADISCGSGSFLLGVFDYLIRYHTHWYNKNRAKAPSADYIEDDEGNYHVSLKKKREILVNNIYGIDIDHQAVEVAQLSLYLKLLEEETTNSARTFQLELHEALLPSLSRNIICGNSLIEGDLLDDVDLQERDERAINAMTFRDRFPAVARQGGFDAIVGNPPWGAELVQLDYLKHRYSKVVARMVDSYIYFIQRGIELLSPNGVLGYIVPATVLNQSDAMPVRQLLLEHRLHAVVNLGQRVFGPKVLNTSAILICGGPSQKSRKMIVGDIAAVSPKEKDEALAALGSMEEKSWRDAVRGDPHLTFFAGGHSGVQILQRMRNKHAGLSTYLASPIQRGVTPDVASAHVLGAEEAKRLGLEAAVAKPSVSGKQVKRYSSWLVDQVVIYTTRQTPITKCPNALHHVERFRSQNTCPEVTDKKHPWWALHRPRDPEIFQSPKFVGLTTSRTIELIYDENEGVYVTDAMYVFKIQEHLDPYAFMAVMQSSAFLFFYRLANQGEGRVIPQVKASKLETLPFPSLAEAADWEPLSKTVLALYEARRRLGEGGTEQAREYDLFRCSDLERRLNEAVYTLYGLSSAEVETIESFLSAGKS